MIKKRKRNEDSDFIYFKKIKARKISACNNYRPKMPNFAPAETVTIISIISNIKILVGHICGKNWQFGMN